MGAKLAGAVAGAGSGAAAGSAFGPWGTGIGAGLGLLAGLFGKKKAPKAVMPKEVDLQEEQRKAVAGNLANQDDIESLVSRANTFTQDQATSLLERALPGWGSLSTKLMGLANESLEDPYAVPKSVEDNIARIASERGISAGTRGEFNDFSMLRDFGNNMLEWGTSRINQASGIMSMLRQAAPMINPMSPMSFYVTPGDAATVAGNNNAATQAVAQGNENARAATSNWNSGNLWSSLIQAGATIGANIDSRKKAGGET